MPAEPSTRDRTNELWGDDWAEVRALWPLEPTVAHLNHGSYGAVPTPVREEQQSWRERMDSNPVRFFARELDPALDQARAEVAQFLGVADEDVAFVRNVTTGVSTVLSCLPLETGDELLVTDHAYGAVRIAAERWTAQAGARLVTVPVPLRADDETATERILAGVTDRTRLVVVDQVTSPTARRMPLVTLVPALRDRGVAVLVDGAHAPGMLPVELDRLGADFWVGNLHKWAFTPRPAAALWVAPPHRGRVRPLVTSWSHGQPFPASFDLLGTVDHSAWLAVPDGLAFWQRLGGADLVAANGALLESGADHVATALGTRTELNGIPHAPCMRLVALPEGVATTPEDAQRLWRELYAARFVVPPVSFEGRGFLRLAAQAYNDLEDYARLATTLKEVLGAA